MDRTGLELTKYVNRTGQIASHALSMLDSNASFRVIPSIDIGVPYDVDRLAGGFPTGVYVEWECSTPIIPVDTTVNCCSASIFKLSSFFDQERFFYNLIRLNSSWEKSSYQMNFNRGNHFITLCCDRENIWYLVTHSTAKEFTKGYNGLYPVKGNWYYDKIKVYEENGRYFRYITGKTAELFTKTAISLNGYNEIRHENIAYYLCNGCVESSSHYHHYGMNQINAIKIGCYTINENELIPIFSKPGYAIDVVQVLETEKRTQDGKLIVPHGWGRAYSKALEINIDLKNKVCIVGNEKFELFAGKSLYVLNDLYNRNYVNEKNKNVFYDSFRKEIKGNVLMSLAQEICMTAEGIYRIRGKEKGA